MRVCGLAGSSDRLNQAAPATRAVPSQIRGRIEPSTAADRLDIYARACGLTRRETEVLALLCEGMDTREIAERIVVSEHTASDHLKAILAKTGARTRQLLLARGLGTR